MDKKTLHIFLGPVIFGFCLLFLHPLFSFKAAVAIGLTAWMGLWWILHPVDIAVTALLPIGVNALFNLVPASHIISQYFSEIVVLLVGSDLVSLTWTNTGLDKRLAIKALCFIGPSMKQQIIVWLVACTLLSALLPNVVVAMLMCPIAVSMLKFVGEEDISTSKVAIPILLAVAWGSGIGGFGSPLGGAANLTAISYLERIIGHEFMYIDWMVRFLPLLFIVMLLNIAILLMMPQPIKRLADTKEYFDKLNSELPKVGRGEAISFVLFAGATVLAFARPLFAASLPAMRPAYVFFIAGLLTFVLKDEHSEVLLKWKQAEKGLMWGMFFLFAGGLALGRLVTETGAAQRLAELITILPLAGGIETISIFVVFSTFLSEISSNTAAASIAIPVVQSIAQQMALNPIPYIMAVIVAVNCAYILPLSTRAIPVSYGLNPSNLFRYGLRLTLLNIILTTVIGYVIMRYIPAFSQF
ncbi:MAG: SLC13 family permease [Phascolarctobacterium sp.]|nr:SLC13 family permease [Phascolarctobacterium sp.]